MTTNTTSYKAQYASLPTASIPPADYSRELSNLSKMYEPDLKYHGNDDSFDFKLNIFMELCEKSAISEPINARAYLTMLSGSALTNYYSTTSNGHCKDFDSLCTATREDFEGPKMKRNRSAR